jgi:rare lipoprotein A
MTGLPQDRIGMAKWPLLVLAGFLLAACEEGSNPFGGDGTTQAASGQSVELVETDVEAPEIFQVTDSGLWDGRPSLGGVWVAHPDVTDPERVIIRNQENGTFVIGALFRRERDNPGPALQVSSDAAEALQMLAGAPAQLNVTALRREEAATPAPAEATAAFDEAPAIETAALDPIAGAAAAIEAAEGLDASATADVAPAVTTTSLDSAAPVAEAAPPPAPSTSELNRPYIQLGIFSVEANANALASDLQAKGLSTRVVAQESQGKSFWRVLVGPAQTEAERDGLLERVKAEGFADAYFVDN